MLIIEYVEMVHGAKDLTEKVEIQVSIHLLLLVNSFKFYRKPNVRRLSMLTKK